MGIALLFKWNMSMIGEGTPCTSARSMKIRISDGHCKDFGFNCMLSHVDLVFCLLCSRIA